MGHRHLSSQYILLYLYVFPASSYWAEIEWEEKMVEEEEEEEIDDMYVVVVVVALVCIYYLFINK